MIDILKALFFKCYFVPNRNSLPCLMFIFVFMCLLLFHSGFNWCFLSVCLLLYFSGVFLTPKGSPQFVVTVGSTSLMQLSFNK